MEPESAQWRRTNKVKWNQPCQRCKHLNITQCDENYVNSRWKHPDLLFQTQDVMLKPPWQRGGLTLGPHVASPCSLHYSNICFLKSIKQCSCSSFSIHVQWNYSLHRKAHRGIKIDFWSFYNYIKINSQQTRRETIPNPRIQLQPLTVNHLTEISIVKLISCQRSEYMNWIAFQWRLQGDNRGNYITG